MDVSPSAMELEEVGRVRARLRFRMLSIPCGLTGLVEVPENPHYEALCTLLGGSTDLSAWPAFTEEASPLDDSFVFLDSKYYFPINPLFLSLSLSL